MARKQKFDYDLIIIGSGAGGSTAAVAVAKSGQKVALIESGQFGGTSPNSGDIPTKALLNAALVYYKAKSGARFGLRPDTLGFNFLSLREWKESAVKRTGVSTSRKFLRETGVDVIDGFAHFISHHEVSVARKTYSARKFIIASGAKWNLPDIEGLQESGYESPNSIFENTKLPKSVFLIGSSDTAIETAQILAILGTKVYLATKDDQLLPTLEPEVGESIKKALEATKNVVISTKTDTVSVIRENIAKRVYISRGGATKSIRVDEVILATERQPNTDIGLDNAGIKYDATGITIDEHLQTTNKDVYAVGDVLSRHGHTHMALIDGKIAANNVISKSKMISDYAASPRVIFTMPSVATVGMTEAEAKSAKLSYKKSTAPIGIVARSNVDDFADGFVKLITDKKGVLLGATIVAPNAVEIIHELALAIKYGLTASQVAATPHAYLTWSEAIRVAASKI